jgi:hypothetical protein
MVVERCTSLFIGDSMTLEEEECCIAEFRFLLSLSDGNCRAIGVHLLALLVELYF